MARRRRESLPLIGTFLILAQHVSSNLSTAAYTLNRLKPASSLHR